MASSMKLSDASTATLGKMGMTKGQSCSLMSNGLNLRIMKDTGVALEFDSPYFQVQFSYRDITIKGYDQTGTYRNITIAL